MSVVLQPAILFMSFLSKIPCWHMPGSQRRFTYMMAWPPRQWGSGDISPGGWHCWEEVSLETSVVLAWVASDQPGTGCGCLTSLAAAGRSWGTPNLMNSTDGDSRHLSRPTGFHRDMEVCKASVSKVLGKESSVDILVLEARSHDVSA